MSFGQFEVILLQPSRYLPSRRLSETLKQSLDSITKQIFSIFSSKNAV